MDKKNDKGSEKVQQRLLLFSLTLNILNLHWNEYYTCGEYSFRKRLFIRVLNFITYSHILSSM